MKHRLKAWSGQPECAPVLLFETLAGQAGTQSPAAPLLLRGA